MFHAPLCRAMCRTLLAWLALGTSLLSAQEPPAATDPLVAGKQRLATALQKTAAMSDTGFTATWGPDTKKKGDDDRALAMFGNPAGKATGSWHADLQHVVFDGETADELLIAGTRTIARDSDHDWCLRGGRFADGNTIPFTPDVALLLRQIASMDLAVVHRTAGSLDDRPVEIVTVTLNGDQVLDLAWSGALPEALVANAMPLRFAMFGGGKRQAPPRPEATLDLAIALDPGTSLVQQLHFRSWTKDDGNGQRVVIGGGAGVMRVVGRNAAGNDEEDEDEGEKKPADDTKPPAPMQYENGLPMRPRKKMAVMDYTVRLADHGSKKGPMLDGAQQKLLGR